MLKLNVPVLAALLFAAAAQADEPKATAVQYRGCDGYGQALEDSDGITVHWTVWGMVADPGAAPGATAMTAPGATGIADCDAALADLNAKHWLRKVSLLRARAMHRLETKDAAGAMADLDLAQQAGTSGDVFYARSLGVGIDFLRAYALRVGGDQAKAEALAMRTMEAHPFSRQMMGSALLAMGNSVSDAGSDKAHKYLARLMPTGIDDLYLTALSQFRYQDAIALYSQLVPYREIGRVNITSGQQRERDLRDFKTAEVFWAVRSGAYAFALAALGRTGEAKATLQSARDRVAANTAPPPPSDPSKKDYVKTEALRGEVAEIHARTQTECTAILAAWQALVDLRVMVSESKGPDALALTRQHPLPKGWPSIDIMDGIEKQLPKAQKPKTPLAQPFRDAMDQARAKRREPTPESLYRSLPDAETVARVPPYAPVSKSFFDSDPNGIRVKTDGDVTTVAVRGDKGTGAMIEEIALLKSADLARAAGKKGFVVIARSDTAFQIDTVSYGRTIATAPNGYETSLDVVFVDPQALPPKLQAAPWRVIDADAVYDALAPVYIRAKQPR